MFAPSCSHSSSSSGTAHVLVCFHLHDCRTERPRHSLSIPLHLLHFLDRLLGPPNHQSIVCRPELCFLQRVGTVPHGPPTLPLASLQSPMLTLATLQSSIFCMYISSKPGFPNPSVLSFPRPPPSKPFTFAYTITRASLSVMLSLARLKCWGQSRWYAAVSPRFWRTGVFGRAGGLTTSLHL